MNKGYQKDMPGQKNIESQYPQPISYSIPQTLQNINVINNPYDNNQSNKNKMVEEFSKLNQKDKNEILKQLMENNNQMKNNYNYDSYLNEDIQKEYEKMQLEYEERFQTQKVLDAQLMRQKLDYKDCWDFYYSAIATIENLALGISQNKEYGKYDEFDACSFKDKNQLVIQLLKILKNFRGAFNDYIKDYKVINNCPEDLNITLNQIKNWKNMINDENINKYLDELVNILNRKSKMDFQKELNKYYSYYTKKKNVKETIQKGVEGVIYIGSHVRKEEREFKKQFEEKGDLPDYKVERGVPSGKYKNWIDSKELKRDKKIKK